MSASRMTTGDVERMTSRMMEEAVGAADRLGQQVATLQEQHAERLAGAHQRLAKELGADHPRVDALAKTAAAAQGMGASLRAAVTRRARRPTIRSDEWMVFGQVRTAERQPAAGVRVRLSDKGKDQDKHEDQDKERTHDALLGGTYTNEFGEFALVYSERHLAERRKDLPELYVFVEDEQGKELYASRAPLRFKPGRADYFDIVLPAERAGSAGRT
jgi:hypothetical protein